MPNEAHDNFIAPARERQPTKGRAVFSGFAAPTSNTTYTPNQFFDVCLPNASRGCVRIVAFLIRQTLGWCDADGNPQRERIAVGYHELIRRAGLSRDMIRAALNEGMAGHFIECVRAGRRSSAGDFGETALFTLKWDAGADYIRHPARFRGFFEGEGNRTDIPNEFFDRLIPTETLSVIKVVGSVIRYSIGFQAKHGKRRQQAALAYSQLLKAGGLSSRRTLAAAIHRAIREGYILRIDPGYFSAKISERRSAVYAVRWSDGFSVEDPENPTSRKRIPAELWINRSEKDTSGTPDQSEKDTSTSPKRTPADQSEKDTIEIKQLNEIQKQDAEAVSLLKKEGFDHRTAKTLTAEYGRESVARQIQWLPQRTVSRNKTGLLRRAIEGNWPPPVSAKGAEEPPRLPELPSEYLAWLAGEYRSLAKVSPDDRVRFEAKRERRRVDLNREKSVRLREQLLAGHDSETGRLMDFQKFLTLPDVRQWAQIFNKNSTNNQS